ncbi:MAG: tyrosine recombinase XerC [bacterium]|nr:tyrosine recombinase XerC [bacterium]
MSKSLLNCIEEFKSHLSVERNLSHNTVAGYSHDLMKFTAFMLSKYGKEPLVTEITTQDIRDFLAYLQQKRRVKSYAIFRKISCLRTFFAFLLNEKHIKMNPMETIQSPKLAKKLPVYLTQDELKKLLSAPNINDPIGIRDLAILTLFSYTGMRLSELVHLNLQDVNLQERFVRVMGKGSKERIIPLVAPVIKVLSDYLDIRPFVDNDALFLSSLKKRISPRMVQYLVNKYRIKAGISQEKFSPHKLRHTFATMLHGKDVDLIDIQALLGHSSVATTQIYTHTNPKKLQKAVEKLI